MIKELKERLKSGKVSFTYKKKDGSLRNACGTTNMDVIPENDRPKDSAYEYDGETVCRYYDTNSEGWRSFVVENLVSIDD